MNVYFMGMCISMVIFVLIGVFVSRGVKDANDYYVAGRRAPVLLITGSLIAHTHLPVCSWAMLRSAMKVLSRQLSYLQVCSLRDI